MFPWCTRPARGCDVDHVVEYDHDADAEGRPQPGPDRRPSNLGALCRFHHRLKTHTAWTYRMIAPGVFEWTSPHGHRYRRDRHGTTRDRPPDDPSHPTDHDPAPHPASPGMAGPQACSRPSLRTEKVRTVTSEATYQGDDFYCDVAIPRSAELDVVHDDDVGCWPTTTPGRSGRSISSSCRSGTSPR